jgi:hypothetical protein
MFDAKSSSRAQMRNDKCAQSKLFLQGYKGDFINEI